MQVILLQYPGVTGEATIAGYENYISIDEFSMGTSDSDGGGSSLSQKGYGDSVGFEDFDDEPGGSSGSSRGESRRLGIDSLKVTKSVDQSTPSFLQMAFKTKADVGPTVKLVVLRAYERQAPTTVSTSPINWHEPFLTVELKDAHITAHSLAVGKDSLSENIDISFKQLTMDYILYKNGVKVGTVSKFIDLTKKATA